jgi:hypothetical protein
MGEPEHVPTTPTVQRACDSEAQVFFYSSTLNNVRRDHSQVVMTGLSRGSKGRRL